MGIISLRLINSELSWLVKSWSFIQNQWFLLFFKLCVFFMNWGFLNLRQVENRSSRMSSSISSSLRSSNHNFVLLAIECFEFLISIKWYWYVNKVKYYQYNKRNEISQIVTPNFLSNLNEIPKFNNSNHLNCTIYQNIEEHWSEMKSHASIKKKD